MAVQQQQLGIADWGCARGGLGMADGRGGCGRLGIAVGIADEDEGLGDWRKATLDLWHGHVCQTCASHVYRHVNGHAYRHVRAPCRPSFAAATRVRAVM